MVVKGGSVSDPVRVWDGEARSDGDKSLAEGDFRGEQLTSWARGGGRLVKILHEWVWGHIHTHTNSLSLWFDSGHIWQGQGSHSASLSESPGELARNAGSRQDPSLPPRDSGNCMTWDLDIPFPGEDWVNHYRATRKVFGVKIPLWKIECYTAFMAVCLQFSYTTSLGYSCQGNKGDGPEQNDDEDIKVG